MSYAAVRTDTWPLRQAMYLKKTSWTHWAGTNGPCLMVYWLINDDTELNMTDVWCACFVVMSTAVFIWRQNSYRLLFQHKITAPQVLNIHLLLLALSVVLWSYLSLVIFPESNLWQQAFIIMVIAGVAAGSFPINAISKPLCQATLVGLLLPFVVGSYLAPSEFGTILSGALLIYLLVLMRVAFVLTTTIKNEFHLALHNESLRQQLESKTTQMISQAQRVSAGELAGSMAHEINNPLTILAVNLELLNIRLNEPNFDKSKFPLIINKMTHSIERITRIIRELRSYTQNSEVSSQPTSTQNLEEIVNYTLMLCKERTDFNNIELRVGAIPIGLQVRSNKTDISNALMHVITNACQAVEKCDEKWIEITFSEFAGEVQISVSDSGPGISHEVRDQVMLPFFTTKSFATNLGLGLTITQNIMHAHGGSLQLLENTKHTTFVLSIPKLENSDMERKLKVV